MTFLPRLLIVSLAAFAAAGLVASALWPLLVRRPLRGSPVARASILFERRLMPVAASLGACLLGMAAMARFEPRDGYERTSAVLMVLAAFAVATIAAGIARFVREQTATSRGLRAWMASAEPIALPAIAVPVYAVTSIFPIVAVVGIFRPRLIVARSVLDACSAGELAAIVAHEGWHVRHRDNARRAILSILPDVLAWAPASRRLIDQWHTAIEDAADDAAARLGVTARVDLAAALVRVARLAPAGTPAAGLPVSALYRGEQVERRVRRMLDGSAGGGGGRHSTWLPAWAGGWLVVSLLTLRPIHEFLEVAVSYLP